MRAGLALVALWTLMPLPMGCAGGSVIGAGGGGGAPAESTGGQGGVEALLEAGESCSAPTECSSGFCSDGVCCRSGCDGDCEGCSARDGVCEPHAAGTDPDDDCGLATCDGSGACELGAVVWAAAISTSAELVKPGVSEVAVDSIGGVVVGGDFDGSLFALNNTIELDADIHLRRYTANGSVAVDVEFGSATEHLGGLATVGTRVLAAGDYSDAIDLGGGAPLPATNDRFVAELDAAFAQQWRSTFGSDTGAGSVEDIAGDPDGVVACGGFSGAITIGSTTLTAEPGSRAPYVARYTSAGVPLWAVAFSGSGINSAVNVAKTATGVYVAGSTTDTVNLGGVDLAGAGTYVGKLDEHGAHVWSKHFPATHLGDLVVLSDDHVVVTGSFSGIVNLGGSTVTSTDAADDIFVVRLDAAGNHVWSQAYGGVGDDRGVGVGRSSLDQIVVAGWMTDSIDFGGGAVTSQGARDVFVVTLDAAGIPVWTRSFGSAGDDVLSAIDVSEDGDIAMVGTFASTIVFGEEILTPTSPAGADGFVVKLTP